MKSVMVNVLEPPRFQKIGKLASIKKIPAEIIGRWSVSGSPFVYIFTLDGKYYVEGTYPFNIAADGLTLDLNGTVYDRVLGAGMSIEGVWSHYYASDDLTEEYHFRADGTYTGHWSDGLDYIGTYSVNGGNLTMAELRAIVSTTGDSITFDPPYGQTYFGTFVIGGDTLTVTFPSVTVVYTRAP